MVLWKGEERLVKQEAVCVGAQADSGKNKHISIGLLAHVDAGKTTLAEGLLYTGGRIRKLGRVDPVSYTHLTLPTTP